MAATTSLRPTDPPTQTAGSPPPWSPLRWTPRSASWRQVVSGRVARLRARTRRACYAADPGALLAASGLVDIADEAACAPNTPARWWSGTLNERAWLALHEAEALLLEQVASEDELPAVAEDVLADARRTLDDRDERVVGLRTALARGKVTRTAVTHLARAAWDASDSSYAKSRSYRNRLIVLSLMALAAAGLLVAACAAWIPLPLEPATATETLSVGPLATYLLLALLGAVGALTSSVRSVTRFGGARNPFSLPLFQLLLKLSLGPVFAIVGVLVLRAGIVPDLPAPTTLGPVLLWAFLFGSSQQLLSGLADQRVASLLGSRQTEESEA